MKVIGLYEYPVKGCAGVAKTFMSIGRYGPAFDRKFMVVHAKTGRMVTQRSHPKLALVETAIEFDNIEVRNPEVGTVKMAFGDKLGEPMQVFIHDQPACIGYLCHQSMHDFFSEHLGGDFRLVRYATKAPRVRDSTVAKNYRVDTFADGHPLLIISVGAIARLNHRLKTGVSERNFRPNIVVNDCSPHAEDEKLVLQHDRLRLRWVKLCERCGVPEVNPDTGTIDRTKREGDYLPVTAAMRTYRPLLNDAPVFGSNYMVETAGTLSLGDTLEVSNL